MYETAFGDASNAPKLLKTGEVYERMYSILRRPKSGSEVYLVNPSCSMTFTKAAISYTSAILSAQR